MRVSCADRAFRLATALLLGGLAWAGPAVAQTPGAPTPLGPPVRLGPPAKPAKPAPVVRAELPASPGAEGAGTLTPENGGLPGRPWTGTPRVLVERLLPILPAATASPTVRDLTRRLLLTATASAAGPATISIAGLRLERLDAMGAFGDIAALVEVAPSLLDDVRADAAWHRSRLLAGDVAAVCADAAEGNGKDTDAQKLSVLCLAENGKAEAASLALEILRDQQIDDAAFLAIGEVLAGGAADPIEGLSDPSPLHLAMLRAAKLPVPASALSVRDPGRLLALAQDPAGDPAVRAEAAERAARFGALDAAGLAEAYRNVPDRPAAPGKTLDAAGRALLFQAMSSALTQVERAELAARALGSLPVSALAGPVGTAWAEALNLEPEPDASPAALAVSRLLLARGQAASAEPWLELAAQTDPAAARRLWPLALIAGEAPLSEAGIGLSAWLDDAVAAGGQARRSAGTILSLLDALGETVDEATWLAVLEVDAQNGSMPAPTLWQRLREATSRGDAAETVLVALAILGDREPAEVPIPILSQIVRGLRVVGLDGEARSLVREAILPMVVSGPP